MEEKVYVLLKYFLYPIQDNVRFFRFLQQNKLRPTLKKNLLKGMTSLQIL